MEIAYKARPVGGRVQRLLRLSDTEQELLVLAGLPLFDGVFVGALAGEGLASPRAAAAFGMGVFSGAGCVTTALQLPAELRQRLRAVVRVYGVLLPAALLCAALSPTLRGVLLPNFAIFAALVLVGVALDIAGVRAVPESPRPDPRTSAWWAPWWWSLRLALAPQVALTVAGVASVLYALSARPNLSLELSGSAVASTLCAVLAGAGLTLGAALFGSVGARWIDTAWLRAGGALALGCLALRILGLPLPASLPALIMVGLTLTGSVLKGAHRARGRR